MYLHILSNSSYVELNLSTAACMSYKSTQHMHVICVRSTVSVLVSVCDGVFELLLWFCSVQSLLSIRSTVFMHSILG